MPSFGTDDYLTSSTALDLFDLQILIFLAAAFVFASPTLQKARVFAWIFFKFSSESETTTCGGFSWQKTSYFLRLIEIYEMLFVLRMLNSKFPNFLSQLMRPWKCNYDFSIACNCTELCCNNSRDAQEFVLLFSSGISCLRLSPRMVATQVIYSVKANTVPAKKLDLIASLLLSPLGRGRQETLQWSFP